MLARLWRNWNHPIPDRNVKHFSCLRKQFGTSSKLQQLLYDPASSLWSTYGKEVKTNVHTNNAANVHSSLFTRGKSRNNCLTTDGYTKYSMFINAIIFNCKKQWSADVCYYMDAFWKQARHKRSHYNTTFIWIV